MRKFLAQLRDAIAETLRGLGSFVVATPAWLWKSSVSSIGALGRGVSAVANYEIKNPVYRAVDRALDRAVTSVGRGLGHAAVGTAVLAATVVATPFKALGGMAGGMASRGPGQGGPRQPPAPAAEMPPPPPPPAPAIAPEGKMSAGRVAVALCRAARNLVDGDDISDSIHPKLRDWLMALSPSQLQVLASGRGGEHLDAVKQHVLGHEQLGNLPPLNRRQPAEHVAPAPQAYTFQERLAASRAARNGLGIEADAPAMAM